MILMIIFRKSTVEFEKILETDAGDMIHETEADSFI